MALFKKKYEEYPPQKKVGLMPPPPPAPKLSSKKIVYEPPALEKDEIDEVIESIKAMDGRSKKPLLFSAFFKKRGQPAKFVDSKKFHPEPHLRPESNNIGTINNLIKSARNHLLDLKIEEAKHDYTEIIRIYNQLKPEEQKKIYDDIKDIYNDRKNAESLNLNI